MCFAAIGAALGAGAATATSAGIAATSGALGIASAGLQYSSQRQQAKQQAEFQKQSIEASQKKTAMQGTAAVLEEQQRLKAIGQEKGKIAARGEAVGSRAVVAAGEAGVSGLSVQALMDDYIRQQAGQVAALTSQDKLYALRHGLNLQQLSMVSEQELLGLSRPIEQPSALGASLDAFSSGIGAYGSYRSMAALDRPAYIDTGMGTSSYLPDTDQYTLPARSSLKIKP